VTCGSGRAVWRVCSERDRRRLKPSSGLARSKTSIGEQKTYTSQVAGRLRLHLRIFVALSKCPPIYNGGPGGAHS
jgi:hypothetical protein